MLCQFGWSQEEWSLGVKGDDDIRHEELALLSRPTTSFGIVEILHSQKKTPAQQHIWDKCVSVSRAIDKY